MRQHDTRTLRHVEPAKANSREAEVAAARSDRKLRVESNTLSVRETKTMPDEDATSVYKLQLCLRRRAVAYEFAGLISFSEHAKHIDKLMRRLYEPTCVPQILRAYREVWVFLSQCVPDIRKKADGARPLDAALHQALQDYNVAFHLLPLPQQHGGSYAAVRSQENAGGFARDSRPSPKGKKSKGYGKSNGGGSSLAPRGVAGAVGRDNKGRPVCFNFNLSERKDAPVGGVRKRGRHVCFKINCFKPHAFSAVRGVGQPKMGNAD